MACQGGKCSFIIKVTLLKEIELTEVNPLSQLSSPVCMKFPSKIFVLYVELTFLCMSVFVSK